MLIEITTPVTAKIAHNLASLARSPSLRCIISASFLSSASMTGMTANLHASQRAGDDPCDNFTDGDACAAANRTDRFEVLFRRGLVRFVYRGALSEPALRLMLCWKAV